MYVKKWIVWTFLFFTFSNFLGCVVSFRSYSELEREFLYYKIDQAEKDRLYANSIIDLEERFQESEKKKREGKFLKDLIKILSVL